MPCLGPLVRLLTVRLQRAFYRCCFFRLEQGVFFVDVLVAGGVKHLIIGNMFLGRKQYQRGGIEPIQNVFDG